MAETFKKTLVRGVWTVICGAGEVELQAVEPALLSITTTGAAPTDPDAVIRLGPGERYGALLVGAERIYLRGEGNVAYNAEAPL